MTTVFQLTDDNDAEGALNRFAILISAFRRHSAFLRRHFLDIVRECIGWNAIDG
jgi:hypothetical protein